MKICNIYNLSYSYMYVRVCQCCLAVHMYIRFCLVKAHRKNEKKKKTNTKRMRLFQRISFSQFKSYGVRCFYL